MSKEGEYLSVNHVSLKKISLCYGVQYVRKVLIFWLIQRGCISEQATKIVVEVIDMGGHTRGFGSHWLIDGELG